MVDTSPYSLLFDTLRQRLGTNIEDDQSTGIHWINQRYVPEVQKIWVQQQVELEPSEMIGFGAIPRYRQPGVMRCVIREQIGKGNESMMTLADQIVAVFEGLRTDTFIEYGQPYMENSEPDSEFARWRQDVVIPFTYDDDWPTDPRVGTTQLHTRDSAHDAVRDQFGTRVVDVYSPVPVMIADNDAATQPPVFNPNQPVANALWVRFHVQTGIASRHGPGVGASKNTVGLATAMIFIPNGAGMDATLAFVDKCVLRFRSVHVDGITYGAPWPNVIGRQGQWHQTNVEIPFTFHEVTT